MKMEMPKMDVVRFQEADVIVASSAPDRYLATLGNFGDGKSANGWLKITHNGVESTHDWSALLDDNETGYAQNLTFNGVSLGKLMENDTNNTCDGNYESTNGLNYTRQ